MRVEWEKTIATSDHGFLNAKFDGVFAEIDGELRFFSSSIHDRGLNVISIFRDEEETAFSYDFIEERGRTFSIPSCWHVDHKRKCIICDSRYEIDMQSFEVREASEEVCASIREEHERNIKEYLKKYSFGDFEVFQKSEQVYCCVQNGQEKWRIRCQGYLYTPILAYEDKLYWGTDGAGGYFCLVESETGNIVAKIKTGGTNKIVGEGKKRYVLLQGNKPEILELSLETGEITDRVSLPGYACSDSALFWTEKGLYTVTFRAKKGMNTQAVLLFVSFQ